MQIYKLMDTASIFEGDWTDTRPTVNLGTGALGAPVPAIPQVAEPRVDGPGLRLRRRGKATVALQRMGEALPGWWREGLTGCSGARIALSWIEDHLRDSGVKLGRVGHASTKEKEGAGAPVFGVQALFESEEGSRWLWLCPELVAHLYLYRAYRPVSEMVLSSLRSRARLWAEERGLSAFDLARFLAGSLMIAMLPTPDEVVSLGALRGSAAQWSVDVLGALKAGRAVPTSRGMGWADVFKPFLRFGAGTKGSVLGGAGCGSITMPA